MTTQSPNPSPDPQADDAVGHETGYESGTVVIHPHQAQQTKAQAPFWLKASRTLGWSVVLMGTATASALLGAAAILTVP
ncbi:MAG: hypothetical protein AAFY67_12820, partial [Cyanobacteria bacterium J06642_9]